MYASNPSEKERPHRHLIQFDVAEEFGVNHLEFSVRKADYTLKDRAVVL